MVRGLASAVVQAVEDDDLDAAVAGARVLVAFLGALLGDATNSDNGNDDGVRAGLAFVVSPAPAPGFLAMGWAA